MTIIDSAERTVGRGHERTLFKYEEQYDQIRGVRYLSVGLQEKSSNGLSLKGALETYLESNNSNEGQIFDAVARVAGTLSSGQQVACVRRLDHRKLADGFIFASIRHSECMGEENAHCGHDCIYFNHFSKIYKCVNGPALDIQNSPDVSELVLQSREIAPSAYDKARNIIRRIGKPNNGEE